LKTNDAKSKAFKNKTGIVIVMICFLFITGFLIYYQLWYKSKTVNSNIFKLTIILTGHHAEIWSVKFSPDGCCVASGSSDNTIELWQLSN
jgi:WD40 repeat protein